MRLVEGHWPSTREVSHGTDRAPNQNIYCHTSGRAGVANSGTGNAVTSRKVANQHSTGYEARVRTSAVGQPGERLPCSLTSPGANRQQNQVARRLRHEGIRVREIIAYRAWRVIEPHWWRPGDDRLHSVLMQDYVWHPDQPASGDIGTHRIYSFRDVVRSNQEYWYSVGRAILLFGKVKIWGEVVEHEAGYRSQFGKIISLDYGGPELLEKFRKIYRVNQAARTEQ